MSCIYHSTKLHFNQKAGKCSLFYATDVDISYTICYIKHTHTGHCWQTPVRLESVCNTCTRLLDKNKLLVTDNKLLVTGYNLIRVG